MITLDDIYRDADMGIIMHLHPNWEFYRNDKGFLCCRTKKQNKKEPNSSTSATVQVLPEKN